jgi:uncharacterized protein (UPF0218 family)
MEEDKCAVCNMATSKNWSGFLIIVDPEKLTHCPGTTDHITWRICTEGSLVLILKKNLRSDFKKPLGDLYPSLDDVEDFLKSKYADELLISVGDVTTHNLQKAGLIPHLGIIDNIIERNPASYDVVYDNVTLNVKNPPGVITDELQETIKKAFKWLNQVFMF